MSTQTLKEAGPEGAVKSVGNAATALGVLAIILGIIALLSPGLAGLSIAVLLGIIVIAGGLSRIYWAFQSDSLGKGIFKFVLAALTLICGAAIIANPLLGAGVLTILLVVYFIADGAIEIGASFDIGIGNGGGWLLFGGVVSILLGCMMWGQYPLSGAYAMGIFLGIKLFFIGLIMITGGSTLKKAVEN